MKNLKNSQKSQERPKTLKLASKTGQKSSIFRRSGPKMLKKPSQTRFSFGRKLRKVKKLKKVAKTDQKWAGARPTASSNQKL